MSSATETTAIAPTPPSPPQSAAPVRVQLGLAPQSLEEGWRLAQMMSKSSLVPKAFQGKTEDVLVAIQLGIEVGLAPMQALQSIAVINGRPSLWGDGFLALIMASPHYEDHDEFFEVDGKRVEGLTPPDMAKDTTTAVCVFKRRGKATPVVERFTVARAKKAGLIGKQGPWQEYPDRMLKLRARGFAGRDAFPDVLRGITTAEEANDAPPPDVPMTSVIQQPRRIEPGQTQVFTETEASAPKAADAPSAQPAPPRPFYTAGAVCKVANVIQPAGKAYWYIETTDRALTHTHEEQVAKDAQAAQELGTPVRFIGEVVAFTTAPFRIDRLEVVDEEAGR